MSLQYYPYEDLALKPAVRPRAFRSLGAGDYAAIAIIDAILAMALVSFAVNGGVIGTLVVLGADRRVQRAGAAAAGLKGRHPPPRRSEAEREHHIEQDAGAVAGPQHEGGRGEHDGCEAGNPEKPGGVIARTRRRARPGCARRPSVTPAPAPLRDAAPAARGSASAAAAARTPSPTEIHHIAS